MWDMQKDTPILYEKKVSDIARMFHRITRKINGKMRESPSIFRCGSERRLDWRHGLE